jgi:hypothetical protein
MYEKYHHSCLNLNVKELHTGTAKDKLTVTQKKNFSLDTVQSVDRVLGEKLII